LETAAARCDSSIAHQAAVLLEGMILKHEAKRWSSAA